MTQYGVLRFFRFAGIMSIERMPGRLHADKTEQLLEMALNKIYRWTGFRKRVCCMKHYPEAYKEYSNLQIYLKNKYDQPHKKSFRPWS